MRRQIQATVGVLVCLAPHVLAAQNQPVSAEQSNRLSVTGMITAVLPSGQQISGANADVYIWQDDSAFRAVLDSACTASTADDAAWMAARTELADSSGVSLGAVVDQDIRILRSLAQRPHAVTRADSTGRFAVPSIPPGWYWIEAERLLNGKLVQWWRSAMFTSWAPIRPIIVHNDTNLGTKEFRRGQFCTDREPLVGAAAFADDEAMFITSPEGERLSLKVDKPAALAPGSPSPKYPESLRKAGFPGSVTMRFVVDTTGRVDLATALVLRSDDPGFTAAVRSILRELKYFPAELHGTKVRTVVVQPFEFNLSY